MNDDLINILNELDSSRDPTSEYNIASKIKAVVGDNASLEAKAESMAFDFAENYEDRNSGWGTYYGPLMVWTDEQGQMFESPGLSLVTEEVISYWIDRACATTHPMMKARYAGLVWDLSKKATGKGADHYVARLYVESVIETIKTGICEHPTEGIRKLIRAYRVACSLNDDGLVTDVISNAIAYEDSVAEDESAGLWGFCFESFILGKEKLLTEAQKNKLIQDMESRLQRVSSGKDPWVCESAGIPLATLYRKLGKKDEVDRVISIVGGSFELACKDAAPMLASSWYQHAHDIYISFNLSERAESVSQKIAKIGPDVAKEMKSISHTREIPKEKLDKYREAIVEGGLETALNRIALHFLPKKDQVEAQVMKLAQDYPVSFLFSKTIQDHKGRPVAHIGSLEDDLEGNTIHQLSQNLEINAFFLHHANMALTEKYSPQAEEIVEFLFSSPIFEDAKKELLLRGVSAYLEGDYISAISILIPQCEAAIRQLIELVGGVTLKKNRLGGLQLRTFDDLLRDERVISCFGEDTTFYFRVLLTDQRAWNIRNDVCHGICPVGSYNYSVADRVFHVLLCLSQVREKKSNNAAQPGRS